MSKKSVCKGNNPKATEKEKMTSEKSMSEYAATQLPDGAVVDFVFCEDFNGDGIKEAVVGFTRFTPFPPDSAVLFIYRTANTLEHNWLSVTQGASETQVCGTHDNAAAADTNGDGKPELVLSQVLGHEHDISVFIYEWSDKAANLVWRSEKGFYHGNMEVRDIDGDGIAEIIIECGTHTGKEVIEMEEACYHVRKGCVYKWNGLDYAEAAYQVRMPYESYNIAVEFIRAIWLKDYCAAFEMVVMPGFLGIKGLDDSSLNAFKEYAAKKIRPALLRNLSDGMLIPSEPYDSCCQFSGSEDCFNVELVRVNNVIKIYALEIKKNTHRT